MGYQALLFCPEEKIARTVTQVLSELEFAVEPCIEPFAAVKKLMAEHFDAVVVDCDNDQNASLLFKSARNSAINQASLAVAVVEGQAGVAKAFRIGANLVLTKPINVEQAKGTLRVARGLLRKGEGAKPAGAPVPGGISPAPPKTASPVPATPARPATLAAANAKARAAVPPISKPSPFAPAQEQSPVPAAAFSAIPPAGESLATSGGAQATEKSALPVDFRAAPSSANAAANNPASSPSATGAASAAAPAREPAPQVETPVPSVSQPAASPDETTDASPSNAKTADVKPLDSASAAAPTFTFGGANLPETSQSGGSKKIFLAIAAVVFLVVALYFGWTQLHPDSGAHSGSSNPATSAPTKVPASAQSVQVPPSAASAPATSPATTSGEPTAAPQSQSAESHPSNGGSASEASDQADADVPAANSKTGSFAAKTSPSSKPSAQPAASPIVLKSGALKGSAKPAAADAPAPSMVGLAGGGSDGSLSDLTTTDDAAKPILQTLTVSQGVSQGLLLKKVQPAYPPTALRMRTEGVVKLMATIGKTGNVSDVKVLSGEPMLTRSAVDAVKQWKYKPYLLNGNPVEIQTEVTINFKLPN